MSPHDSITSFLAGKRFAVVGASRDRKKYGNKVLRAYVQNSLDAVPVNPLGGEIEGLAAYSDLAQVPGQIDGISIVTPPNVTEQVVAQAASLGIKNIWMQPGADSPRAVEIAQNSGANVISGGPCLLVVLRYHEG